MANININDLRNPALRKFFGEIYEGEVTVDSIKLKEDGVSVPVAFVSSAPVNAVASAGELTVAAQPTADDTFTIGETVYTFIANGETIAEGEIEIGSDLATSQTNIVAAINGTDGTNTAHTLVTAGDFSSDASVITAKVKGTSGDLIATTETFTSESNLFDAETLGTEVAGVDGTVAVKGQMFVDASYVYVAVAANTVAGDNWRRISLGSAY